MKILILGGTSFLGRWLVSAALARKHSLTIFHRGRTNPGLFEGVEELTGDRDGRLEALEGKSWDAVIDTSGYLPRVVRQSAQLLAGKVNHYTFISSISVYSDLSRPGIDENAPLEMLPEEAAPGSPESEDVNRYYGALKVLCEQEVNTAFPGASLIVRPGLIVGPYDPTDRFTYWIWRMNEGGEVLAPGDPSAPVQFIDVRDLAEWTIRMVENGETGAFNATGPAAPLSMNEFLEGARLAARSSASLTWVDDGFLLRQGVQPWMELPLWLPGNDHAGMLQVRIDGALQKGLVFRPLEDTVRATLEWLQTRSPDHDWRAGMKLEREAQLLKEWKDVQENPGR